MSDRLLSVAKGLERACGRLAELAAKVAALGILTIVGLLVLSSLQRYIAGAPIPVTEELAGLLFLGSAFLSLAFGFTENRHVRLELLWRMLSSPWREIAELVGLVLAVVALIFLIHVTYSLGADSLDGGHRSEMTEIMLWPWRMLIPAGLGLFLMAILIRLLVRILELCSGTRQPAHRDESAA